MYSLYCGCACCAVDADGVVLLPDADADAIGLAGGEELILSTHESDRCLIGYRLDEFHALRDRGERRRLTDAAAGASEQAHLRRSRRTFGVSERAPRVGRGLRISETMRHLGKIGNSVLLVGAGERFELWNPAIAVASDDAEFSALAAHRLRRYRRHQRTQSRRARPIRKGQRG